MLVMACVSLISGPMSKIVQTCNHSPSTVNGKASARLPSSAIACRESNGVGWYDHPQPSHIQPAHRVFRNNGSCKSAAKRAWVFQHTTIRNAMPCTTNQQTAIYFTPKIRHLRKLHGASFPSSCMFPLPAFSGAHVFLHGMDP